RDVRGRQKIEGSLKRQFDRVPRLRQIGGTLRAQRSRQRNALGSGAVDGSVDPRPRDGENSELGWTGHCRIGWWTGGSERSAAAGRGSLAWRALVGRAPVAPGLIVR